MSDLPEIIEFKRKLLVEKLSQCNQKQRDFFNSIWNSGAVPEDKLNDAIRLCDRTILKMERERAEKEKGE